MKNNFENRVKFLMKYDLKKSLSEQATGPGITSYTPLNTTQKKETPEIKYPENCQYPDKTLPLPKQPDGTLGIEGFCYYPQSNQGKSNVGKIAGIYLPQDAEIEFWDIKSISDATDIFYKNNKLSVLGIKKDFLIRQMSRILVPGTVKSFVIGNTDNRYEPWMSYSKVDVSNGMFGTLFFKGFFNNKKQPYPSPTWKDERNKYEKFIDEWGNVVQWTGVIATAVAGLFCEGCTLPLAWELALELGIGAAVGVREIQKGEQISGVFSILTGMLPALKNFKGFRGINPKDFDSLSLKFANSGLSKSSEVGDYVLFYNGLNKEEKRIIDQIFRSGDDYTKKELLDIVPTIIKDGLGNKMSKEFGNMWRQNPDLFTKIPLFKRLWARELSTNATLGVAQLLVEWKYGKDLDTSKSETLTKQEKDKLDGLYSVIPDRLQEEMTINILGNPEKSDEIIENAKNSLTLKNALDKEEISSNMSDFYRKQKAIKDSVESAGGKYIQLTNEE
jgi:hypothetical protein